MNKKRLHIVLIMLLYLFYGGYAQDIPQSVPDSLERNSLGTFLLLSHTNPWTISSNPAALAANTLLLPARMGFTYRGEYGDYKKVQEGNNVNHYSFNTERYQKVNKTVFYGSFNYDKSYEKGTDFTDINDPYRGTPYLLIDTVGGDIYDREFYSVCGKFATPLGEHVVFGLATELTFGLAVQDRDPRPVNKGLDLELTPGIIIDLSPLKLGINLLYEYYNEDIEIDIIEDNKQIDFLQLHGLATFTFHEADGFYRLYKNNKYGGEIQFALEGEKLSLLAGGNYKFSMETADDGRKAGNASWSSIKNDSEFSAKEFELFSRINYNTGRNIHNLYLSYNNRGGLGTEIIQRLENEDETGTSNWVTYAREEKYSSFSSKTSMTYSILKPRGENMISHRLELGMSHFAYKQEYFLPDRHESYENIRFNIKAEKSFYPGEHIICLGAGYEYRTNISNELDFTDNNFIFNNILLPDHKFYSMDLMGPSLSLSWEFPLAKVFDRYYFHLNAKQLKNSKAEARLYSHFGTGLVF